MPLVGWVCTKSPLWFWNHFNVSKINKKRKEKKNGEKIYIQSSSISLLEKALTILFFFYSNIYISTLYMFSKYEWITQKSFFFYSSFWIGYQSSLSNGSSEQTVYTSPINDNSNNHIHFRCVNNIKYIFFFSFLFNGIELMEMTENAFSTIVISVCFSPKVEKWKEREGQIDKKPYKWRCQKKNWKQMKRRTKTSRYASLNDS